MSDAASMTPQRERRGRARRQREAQRVHAAIAGVQRRIPTYELLGEEGLLARIEAVADAILQEVGMDFRGDEDALRLWREAGADVDGERVRFPAGLLRSILKTAPSAFIQHARNPQRSLRIGGDTAVFAPAYGSPFVQDLESGRRYGMLDYFEAFVKLAYATPWLHHSGGTVCEPIDIPVNKRLLDMVAAHLRFPTTHSWAR
jgi:trimethylamine--corrinoid protein Co-methyltransferase